MTPGNHEWRGNYSFLSFRLKMPVFKQSNNHYFSFNVGKMHFIGANYIFYDDEGQEEKERMLAWLRNDLEVANASRKERPWIIVFSHYPIYCSYNNYSEQSSKCSSYYGKFKVFDELWYEYRVDLVLGSHVHYWERY
jgi:Predicted phosphohydrolases